MNEQTNTRQNLSGIMEELIEKTDGNKVSLDDVLSAFSNRAYGPLLLVPAVLAVSPIGGIPGMSVITGTIIFLIALQMLFSYSQPWLPKRLLAFKFDRNLLVTVVIKSKPWVLWLERYLQSRLTFLVGSTFSKVIAIICMGLAVLMYPLALVPFAVAAPGTAIILFSLGMTTHDGMLVLLGLIITAVAIYLPFYVF